MFKINAFAGGMQLFLNDVELMHHCSSHPIMEIGKSDFIYRSTGGGLHRINNLVSDWLKLRGFEMHENKLCFYDEQYSVEMEIVETKNGCLMNINLPDGFNYVRLTLKAEKGEAVYGGGVQFSHLNLRGRRYPIWTSEMGLGRHPLRLSTWLANKIADAGGEYWNTYFPQPTFLSTRGYGCLVNTNKYSVLDFEDQNYHRIELLGNSTIHFYQSPNLKELIKIQSNMLGIMPKPPDWVFKGGILGIQGGLPSVRETVDRVLGAGAKLTGIWTQDWTGFRILWQGKRLFWNWEVNQELYPNFKEEIHRRSEQGIRWLTYVNPYFNTDGEQFQIAKKNNFLIKDGNGETLIQEVAGFHIGSIDLTNPRAWQWFKEVIIQENMLGLGIRGWMADYAEDVSQQSFFYDGSTGTQTHNLYPVLWAKLNREAVVEMGLQDEVLIFHRSGYTGATQTMNMNWGGDQVVNWNPNDGFPAGVTGGLSGCMSGVQYYHTDAGGYFSFKWIKRSKELLFHWSEVNVFSPVFRTHEGNRPWAGVQPWQDDGTLAHFSTMTRMHAALSPYLDHLSEEAQLTGLGMMRPFCLKNPARKWQNKKDAFYLGDDLLVFPVMKPGRKHMNIEIPEGDWVSLFNGVGFSVGRHRINCLLGKPIVFYRKGSSFSGVFQEVGRIGNTLLLTD